MEKSLEHVDSEEKLAKLPLKVEHIEPVQHLTCCQKVKSGLSKTSVEPVLFLFVMPSVIAALAMQNLNLDKACHVNLNFGNEVCTALKLRKRSNHTLQEDEVQKLIASVVAWKSAVSTVVPTILMLFVGAWSDKTGRRKICMVMPIFGEIMTCVFNIANTYFFYEVPVEATVLMEIVFPSLTGSWYTMFLATFSYLGDITTKENKTFRIGILNLCMSVGFPIGMALSGILLRYLGYYGVFAISASLHTINICYVFIYIQDHTWLRSKDHVKPSGFKGSFYEFFDLKSLRKTLEIVFKKGEKNKRLRMFLLLLSVCLFFGPMWGEMSVLYIFTRYRFNWEEVKYSMFSTYNFVLHSIGTLFMLSVVSRKLKCDDAVLGMVSTSSKIGGAIIMAFAVYDYQAYLSPLVEIFSSTTPIALRSIASKLVSHQDYGKVYSLIGVTETMMPLIFAPVYSRIYKLSLKTLPGAFLLLSAGITVPAFFIFVWFYHQHKKDYKEQRLTIPETLPPRVVMASTV